MSYLLPNTSIEADILGQIFSATDRESASAAMAAAANAKEAALIDARAEMAERAAAGGPCPFDWSREHIRRLTRLDVIVCAARLGFSRWPVDAFGQPL